MAYVSNDKNEFGTPVSVHTCDACGSKYTLCPALAPNSKSSLAACCQHRECKSYDPVNDIDAWFDGVRPIGARLIIDAGQRVALISEAGR
jgi:hypothetical protein